MAACRLVLHPQKTRIVYCKDTNRGGTIPTSTFDFLGYTFRPRLAAWRGGEYGVSFLPAAADKAAEGDPPKHPALGPPEPDRQGPR